MMHGQKNIKRRFEVIQWYDSGFVVGQVVHGISLDPFHGSSSSSRLLFSWIWRNHDPSKHGIPTTHPTIQCHITEDL